MKCYSAYFPPKIFIKSCVDVSKQWTNCWIVIKKSIPWSMNPYRRNPIRWSVIQKRFNNPRRGADVKTIGNFDSILQHSASAVFLRKKKLDSSLRLGTWYRTRPPTDFTALRSVGLCRFILPKFIFRRNVNLIQPIY